MDVLFKILRQTTWQVLGKIVTAVSTFILLGLISRVYKEAGTGTFTLAVTYLGIFNLLGDFGFNAHVLRQRNTNWQRLLGTRIIWSLVLIGLSLLLLPFLPLGNKEVYQSIIIGSLAILGSSVFVSANLIFQSKHRYDLSVLSSSLGAILGLGFYIYIIYFRLPVPYLLLGYLLNWLLTGLISLILIRRFLVGISPFFDLSYIKNLFKESWPIALTLSLNVIYFRADAFMVSSYHGISQAGIYNIAYSLFQTIIALPTFIMNAYYPLMLKTRTHIKWVAAGLIGLALSGTVLVQLLSSYLINILTGGGFAGATESLRILSLSLPAFFASPLLMWRLISSGKYRTVLAIYAAGLIFNLVLNLFYIPQYSYIGASWVTVISEYLILGLQVASLFKL